MRIQNPIAKTWRNHAAPWLIVVSLALNIAGISMPFLEFRRGLSSDTYSLPLSIQMLWDAKLYVLAVVVAAFSVCFPFAKLAVLTLIVLGRLSPARERSWLAFVERFGKWSMLDVFLVCIMLALANDQLLVGSTPHVGVLCFTSAITLSMITSGLMQRHLGGSRADPSVPKSSWARLAVSQAVLCVLLVGALLVPFLEIDDWLMSDHPISIVLAIAGLWQTHAEILAVVIALFLVVAPLSVSVLELCALLRLRRGGDTQKLRRALRVLKHWEMLDVFALALGIFLVEGRTFIKTDLSWGAFLLALLLVLYWAVATLQERARER